MDLHEKEQAALMNMVRTEFYVSYTAMVVVQARRTCANI